MTTVPIIDNGHAIPINLLVKSKAWAPPNSRVTGVELTAADRVKVSYRYHGLARDNSIEMPL